MKFYAAFQRTSASARLQKLQTSREISYRRIRLAAIKYACRADAVKFRTAPQCVLEVKFRAAALAVRTRNALHIAQGLVEIRGFDNPS